MSGVGRLETAVLGVLLCAVGGCSSSSANDAPPSDAGTDTTTPADTNDTGADGADANTTDAAETSGDVGYPAFSPKPPQLQKAGDPIASPVFATVFFTGDAMQATVDGFLGGYVASASWTKQVAEYGVGVGAVSPTIVLTDTAPTTLSETDADAWIKGKLDGTHAEFGAVDATTLASKEFILFFPKTTNVTLGGTSACASGIGAYHRDVLLATGARVQYAVVPQCTGETAAVVQGNTAYAALAMATDPLIDSLQSGWANYDDDDVVFGFYGSEAPTAFACSGAYATTAGGGSFPRIWSNAEAAAHHDPCIPRASDAGAYFVAVPVATDSIKWTTGTTRGVALEVGKPRTIDVQLWSDGPTSGPWTVTTQVLGAGSDDKLTLDRSTGQNGDVLRLTIPPGTTTGARTYAVHSKLGTEHHVWMTAAVVK